MEAGLTTAFLEYGALGLLALTEMIAIIALWRQYKASQEARISELKLMMTVAEQTRDAIDHLTEALTSRRAK
jgi:hypothetical protein